MDRLGKQLLFASVGLLALVITAGMLPGMLVVDILMVAISQTVSLVPEGLPVAMTIALAVGHVAARLERRHRACRTASQVAPPCGNSL